jgi:hypothetical protein
MKKAYSALNQTCLASRLLLSLAVAMAMLLPAGAYALPADDQPGAPDAAAPDVADPAVAAPDVADLAAGAPDAAAPDAADPAAADGSAITPLDLASEGWTPYTGDSSAQIVSFAIEGNEHLTGHLGIEGPGNGFSLGTCKAASYYLHYDDGAASSDIVYAYSNNSLSSSAFYIVVYDGDSYTPVDIGSTRIESIWTRQVTPGYSALLLQGTYSDNLVTLDVKVTLTPNRRGAVDHRWLVENRSGHGIDIAAIFMLDTDLNTDDNVPIYSIGTNKGMYMDAADGFVRLYFPAIPEAAGGPFDYAAARWIDLEWWAMTFVYGDGLDAVFNRDVPHEPGDVLITGVDTAVYYRYGRDILTSGQARGFTYRIALGDDSGDLLDPDPDPDPDPGTNTPTVPPAPPKTPATGYNPLPVVAMLASLTLGVAAIRRSRRLAASA